MLIRVSCRLASRASARSAGSQFLLGPADPLADCVRARLCRSPYRPTIGPRLSTCQTPARTLMFIGPPILPNRFAVQFAHRNPSVGDAVSTVKSPTACFWEISPLTLPWTAVVLPTMPWRALGFHECPNASRIQERAASSTLKRTALPRPATRCSRLFKRRASRYNQLSAVAEARSERG